MDDEIWARREPDSPCVKLCTIHPAEGICIGCYRTLSEIAGWGAMPPEDRRRIMAELPARAPRLAQRRGGRAARATRRAAE
ncbi:MAG: DUF1289 domain-containing protein [Pseudomonadota bacterium]